jgi:hypothetical protein
MVPTALDASGPPAPPEAIVLYDDRVVTLRTIAQDAKQPDALWIGTRDLSAVNGFEVKPEGVCRADVCIPISNEMLRGDAFNVSAFAKRIGQAVVADTDAGVWSFGEIPLLRGSFVEGRRAPDITVPDRAGRPVHLADLRGRKVLVVTWASW